MPSWHGDAILVRRYFDAGAFGWEWATILRASIPSGPAWKHIRNVWVAVVALEVFVIAMTGDAYPSEAGQHGA